MKNSFKARSRDSVNGDRHARLAAAVIADDVRTFGQLVKNDSELLNVSFGRFPVLSVCYLFGARRICREYESVLLPRFKYDAAEEYTEIYRKFASLAKKSLRYYIDGTVVTPLEALAVRGKSLKLKKVFSVAYKSRAVEERIKKIYFQKDGRKVEIRADGVIIPRGRLTRRAKAAIAAATCAVLLVCAVSGTLVGVFDSVYGNGSKENPYKIDAEKFSSEKFAALASKKGKYLVLTSDVTTGEDWQAVDLAASLLGGGHKIVCAKPTVFNVVSGGISDLTFDFSGVSAEIADNTGLVASENNGNMEKLTLIANEVSINEKSAAEDCYFAGFARINNGAITSCAAQVGITVTGDGQGNAYASGIAGVNNGTVDGCEVTGGFSADTADVSGIVSLNGDKGTVAQCANRAAIKQITASEAWNPNCAGIALTNNGSLVDCLNFGAIEAESSAKTLSTAVYSAGVAAINYGKIERCANYADVAGLSQWSYVYAGGVVARNDAAAFLINCGAFGKITASTAIREEGAEQQQPIFAFAGGVAAYFGGSIERCFSDCRFEITGEAAFSGGMLGLVDYRTAIVNGVATNYIDAVAITDNYFVRYGEIKGIGAMLSLTANVVGSGIDFTGLNGVGSSEALKASDVYWRSDGI